PGFFLFGIKNCFPPTVWLRPWLFCSSVLWGPRVITFIGISYGWHCCRNHYRSHRIFNDQSLYNPVRPKVVVDRLRSYACFRGESVTGYGSQLRWAMPAMCFLSSPGSVPLM